MNDAGKKETIFGVPSPGSNIQAEGQTFSMLKPEAIRSDFLQTFPFDSTQQLIITETSEFTCVCPFSGLPDIAKLRIEYYPRGRRCIELKSLKYYITSYRNVGIYQEAVTHRIRKDLEKILDCDVRVTTFYNTRGGFDTVCSEGKLKEGENE
ncbi:MAG: preQ(1) synthase [Bdellovibrionales bacterium]|nr:preQ(1) synthase [Bdellovibrionales bacterium]